MASLKSYLVNAVYHWSVDCGYTPHVVVDCTVEGVTVPDAYVTDGQITLNISPHAVNEFSLQDDWVIFSARFSGRSLQINIPVKAIIAIFARETGKGINFSGGVWDDEPDGDGGDGPGKAPPPGEKQQSGRKTPRLKVVK